MQRSFRRLVVSGAFLALGLALLLVWERRLGSVPPPLPVLAEPGAFSVTNQVGVAVTSADLRGRVWAFNLIFTRCPGPCADLTRMFREVQQSLPPESAAGLISVTSDPEFDTPEVLSRYAHRFGAKPGNWQFVTGAKPEVRRLAVNELKLVLQDKDEAQRTSPDDLFLHSTMVVLMDRQGRLRAAVEGLEPGAAAKVVELLRRLEKEKQ